MFDFVQPLLAYTEIKTTLSYLYTVTTTLRNEKAGDNGTRKLDLWLLS